MLTCNSCHRSAIRSIHIFDLHSAQAGVLSTFATKSSIPSASTTSTRNHATIANIQKGHHLRLLRLAFRSRERYPLSAKEIRKGPSPPQRRDQRAREANKRHLDINNDGDDVVRTLSKYTADSGLQTELQWTGGDALKLAQSVLDKLKADDAAKALEMIRLSEKMPGIQGSKSVDSVVSWNHVMDYYMSKSLTREAFKVFNEMKKRGHKPDAHTYTIMLRGYTMNHKKPNAVEEAMKVYDSMWRPESNIKPSIIHSNAIIHCLGRALNMDALWSVAGRLPDRGPGAADKWTYTTILNTMQACAVKDAGQLAETDGDQDAAANVIQNAIGEGRRLWEDIVSRWRSGDVNIDQTLVCAMGRLLLLGQKQDWDDIFSLVEQTMRLPRLGPPRNFGMGEHAQEFEDALASPPSINEGTTSGLQQLEEAVADERSPKVKNEFAVVDLSDRPTKARDGSDMPSPYANVGNNVLSLLIEASIKLKAIPTGKAYWERLTNPENEPFVMPDDDNIRSYQRLLRLSRSSKEMIDLLRKPVNGALEGVWYRRATFVIAMSTCARDFKNPNVFTHASTILDLMQDKLPEPDLKVMTMYLSLAMVTTPGISTEIPGEFDARSGENNLIRAIRRFTYSDLDYRIMVTKWVEKHLKEKEEDQLDIGKSRSHLLKAKAARKAEQAPPNPPEGLVEFMQTLNSALDKLLQHSLKLTGKMATAFSNMKRDLSKSLQKLNPEALPPSIDSFYREEPVDELRDNEGPLKAKRYPDKLSKGTGRRMKGPRVVDLEKRHPFLMTESSQERRRSKRGSELTSSRNNDRDRPLGRTRASPSLAEGWSNAWKKSVEKMGNREKEKEWVVV